MGTSLICTGHWRSWLGAIVGAVLSPAASAGCRALAMLPGQTCIVLGALPGQLWGAWAALCALAAWTAASL